MAYTNLCFRAESWDNQTGSIKDVSNLFSHLLADACELDCISFLPLESFCCALVLQLSSCSTVGRFFLHDEHVDRLLHSLNTYPYFRQPKRSHCSLMNSLWLSKVSVLEVEQFPSPWVSLQKLHDGLLLLFLASVPNVLTVGSIFSLLAPERMWLDCRQWLPHHLQILRRWKMGERHLCVAWPLQQSVLITPPTSLVLWPSTSCSLVHHSNVEDDGRIVVLYRTVLGSLIVCVAILICWFMSIPLVLWGQFDHAMEQ